jgi:Tfp pilus assembly protein PilV
VNTVTAFRKLLDRARNDEGISLIEVIVAMMVFAVIAVGAGVSTLTVLKMTEDNRSRQVASNLATSEVDLVRSANDPFAIVNTTKSVTLNGKKYTITRSTSWVEISGADVACGTGTGVMQSKRVNVTVTWDGMLTTTKPVRTDTLISPDDRINDPNLGSIRLSVLTAAGSGSEGVGVTIAAVTGGQTPASQPAATNSDGCSFALKLKPGTYSVTINRSGSVDTDQVTSPSKNVEVTAGGSAAAQFQYDYAGTFNLVYAPGSTVKLPTNLNTTFVSTYGYDYVSGVKSQVALHPITSGYGGIAGKYEPKVTGVTAGCVSPDPGAWPAATVSGVSLAQGVRTGNVAADPKGQATMNIPMGVMTVKTTAKAYVWATSATAPAAASDPGCSVSTVYSFGLLEAGTYTIALPYGTWQLATSGTNDSSGAVKTAIPTGNLGLIGKVLNLFGGTAVTLDPRLPL